MFGTYFSSYFYTLFQDEYFPTNTGNKLKEIIMKIVYYFILFLFISQSLFSQNTNNSTNNISFDSLLMLKGNQSKGKSFPRFTASNKNQSINNSHFAKKITLLNFWFANCPPCIAEMRSLNQLYNKLKYNKNFQFISFTFENEKAIHKMKQRFAMPYPIFTLSKDECYRLNQGNGFPTSIIVDEKGMISFLLSGYETNPYKAHKIIFNSFYPRITKELLKIKG